MFILMLCSYYANGNLHYQQSQWQSDDITYSTCINICNSGGYSRGYMDFKPWTFHLIIYYINLGTQSAKIATYKNDLSWSCLSNKVTIFKCFLIIITIKKHGSEQVYILFTVV